MKFISLQNTWKIGRLVFLMLIGMSVFFALERVCYMDSAFMLFRLVNNEQVIAEGGRLINALPQFIPWVMVKMGCSLNSIVIGFSIMHTLVLYVVFLFIGVFLNQKEIGLMFLALLLISVNETFFDVVTETKFALAFACLFTAFLLSEKNQNNLLGIGILICGFFTHPIFIVYFGLIVTYKFILDHPKSIVKFIIIGVIILVLKSMLFGATAYENDLVSAIVNDTINLFKNSFIHAYFKGLFTTQFLVMVGLIIVLIFRIISLKKWKYLWAYFLITFGLYFILSIVYSKGDSHMMIQKTLFVFHFGLILPLFMLLKSEEFRLKNMVYCLIVIGTFIALFQVIQISKKYTQRVVVLEHFMKRLPNSSDKFIFTEDHINHDVIMGTWALPHESIIVSKIKLNKLINLKNFRERNDTLFLSRFPCALRPTFGYPMMNKDLNLKYFKINENLPVVWLDSTFFLGQ